MVQFGMNKTRECGGLKTKLVFKAQNLLLQTPYNGHKKRKLIITIPNCILLRTKHFGQGLC